MLEENNIPMDFEQARAATETIMDEAQQTEAENTQAPQADLTDQAVQTAEAAARAVVDKDTQLTQMRAQLEDQAGQVESLKKLIEEQNNTKKEEIIEEVLEPPKLNFSDLAYMSEEESNNAQEIFMKEMADYTKKQTMKEISPFIEQAKEAQSYKEKETIINELSQVPELAGIKDILPQLDRIIAKNIALSKSDIPLDEKYITAYAIATGINAMNNKPKEPTPQEIVDKYKDNKDFRQIIEQMRIAELNNSQQVPPFPASSGAANVALNIQSKPQTIDEASERTRKMFGMN